MTEEMGERQRIEIVVWIRWDLDMELVGCSYLPIVQLSIISSLPCVVLPILYDTNTSAFVFPILPDQMGVLTRAATNIKGRHLAQALTNVLLGSSDASITFYA